MLNATCTKLCNCTVLLILTTVHIAVKCCSAKSLLLQAGTSKDLQEESHSSDLTKYMVWMLVMLLWLFYSLYTNIFNLQWIVQCRWIPLTSLHLLYAWSWVCPFTAVLYGKFDCTVQYERVLGRVTVSTGCITMYKLKEVPIPWRITAVSNKADGEWAVFSGAAKAQRATVVTPSK